MTAEKETGYHQYGVYMAVRIDVVASSMAQAEERAFMGVKSADAANKVIKDPVIYKIVAFRET